MRKARQNLKKRVRQLTKYARQHRGEAAADEVIDTAYGLDCRRFAGIVADRLAAKIRRRVA